MQKKKIIGIVIAIVVILGVVGGIGGHKYIQNKEYATYLVNIKDALNNKDYSESLDYIQKAKAIKDTSSLNDLNNIIVGYQKANEDFQKNDLKNASIELNKIPKDYVNYGIKSDINLLKSNIENKQNLIATIDKEINENKEILKSNDFKIGKKNLISINTGLATSEQKSEINSIISEGNAIRKNYNELIKKKKEEEALKKVQAQKDLDTSKESISLKSNDVVDKKVEPSYANNNVIKSSTNQTQNTVEYKEATNSKVTYGPNHIVSETLGIQFNIPYSWLSTYTIKENSNGLYIYMKNPKINEGQGLLAQILKGHVDGVDGPVLNIGGHTYTVGSRTDIGMDPSNPDFKEYCNLTKGNYGINLICNSISSL